MTLIDIIFYIYLYLFEPSTIDTSDHSTGSWYACSVLSLSPILYMLEYRMSFGMLVDQNDNDTMILNQEYCKVFQQWTDTIWLQQSPLPITNYDPSWSSQHVGPITTLQQQQQQQQQQQELELDRHDNNDNIEDPSKQSDDDDDEMYYDLEQIRDTAVEGLIVLIRHCNRNNSSNGVPIVDTTSCSRSRSRSSISTSTTK